MVIYSVALCIMALLSGGALAQADYPQRPIRLIVPFTPVGATDVMARYVERLRENVSDR